MILHCPKCSTRITDVEKATAGDTLHEVCVKCGCLVEFYIKGKAVGRIIKDVDTIKS